MSNQAAISANAKTRRSSLQHIRLQQAREPILDLGLVYEKKESKADDMNEGVNLKMTRNAAVNRLKIELAQLDRQAERRRLNIQRSANVLHDELYNIKKRRVSLPAHILKRGLTIPTLRPDSPEKQTMSGVRTRPRELIDMRTDPHTTRNNNKDSYNALMMKYRNQRPKTAVSQTPDQFKLRRSTSLHGSNMTLRGLNLHESIEEEISELVHDQCLVSKPQTPRPRSRSKSVCDVFVGAPKTRVTSDGRRINISAKPENINQSGKADGAQVSPPQSRSSTHSDQTNRDSKMDDNGNFQEMGIVDNSSSDKQPSADTCDANDEALQTDSTSEVGSTAKKSVFSVSKKLLGGFKSDPSKLKAAVGKVMQKQKRSKELWSEVKKCRYLRGYDPPEMTVPEDVSITEFVFDTKARGVNSREQKKPDTPLEIKEKTNKYLADQEQKNKQLLQKRKSFRRTASMLSILSATAK